MWMQISRVLWLREGDRNIFYFHKVALSRRKSNVITPSILGLSDDTSATEVKRHVTSAFEGCYKSRKGCMSRVGTPISQA